MSIEAPRLRYVDIRRIADEVRARFKTAALPIDILAAAEFDLGYELRPARNLRDDANTEALLLHDQQTIMIDQAYYLDSRQQNRVRFSVAHELGHAYLHQEHWRKFTSIEDWIAFQESVEHDQYEWFESQADEFAGRLLVPRDALEDAIDTDVMPKVKAFGYGMLNSDEVVDAVAGMINGKFGVCAKTIAIRIDREKLWPPASVKRKW